MDTYVFYYHMGHDMIMVQSLDSGQIIFTKSHMNLGKFLSLWLGFLIFKNEDNIIYLIR